MPVQCTLGALSTFKVDLQKEGFVTLFTGTNYPVVGLSNMDKPLDVNGNKISLIANSNNFVQLINLDNNINIPNVTFVSTYIDANTTKDYNFSSLYFDNSNNLILVSGENINYSNNNVDGIVIRKIDSNNTLLSTFGNPPNSSNANASIGAGSVVFGTNGNIILGLTQTLPDLSPSAQPIVKSLSNNGNSVNWTKYITIGSNRSIITVTDYSSNLICCTSNRLSNNISTFDLSENGNTISNVVTFESGTGNNVLGIITTFKYDANLSKIGIVRDATASNVEIIKLTGNTINYEIKGNLNNSSMIFNTLAISGNNLYTTSFDQANLSIDPQFINLACFNKDTGINIWQKNIRVSRANTLYNSPVDILVKNNYVYVIGETYELIANLATRTSTFVVKLPDSGNTAFNNYVIGNSGYTIKITNGNAIFSNGSLANIKTSSTLVLNNANLVNTFSITDTTNTTQSWSYTSTDI